MDYKKEKLLRIRQVGITEGSSEEERRRYVEAGEILAKLNEGVKDDGGFWNSNLSGLSYGADNMR